MARIVEGAPRKRRPFVLLLALAAAAAGGIAVGALTVTRQPAPEPTVPVAAIPTSTPDLRPTPSPRTLTPTVRPTATPVPTPAPTAAPTVPATPVPTIPFIAAPRPTQTPEPRGRAVVFFASGSGSPIAVEEPKAAGGQSQSDHIFYRMAALKTTKAAAPSPYTNVFPTMKAVFVESTVMSPGLAGVGFVVGEMYGDWGVSAEQVKVLLQQIVYTATEEPGIDRVLITQNGKPAVINGVTYDKALAREDVR